MAKGWEIRRPENGPARRRRHALTRAGGPLLEVVGFACMVGAAFTLGRALGLLVAGVACLVLAWRFYDGG